MRGVTAFFLSFYLFCVLKIVAKTANHSGRQALIQQLPCILGLSFPFVRREGLLQKGGECASSCFGNTKIAPGL